MNIACNFYFARRIKDHRKDKAEARLRHESHVIKKNALITYAFETVNVKKLFEKIIELDF